MKILWFKSDFLHPTTRGGQIRTLEILRRLHSRHEIHYVAFDDPRQPEGLRRSHEYCFRAYPVCHLVPQRRSLRFAGQLARGLVASEPVSIRRYRSAVMHRVAGQLMASGNFDVVVCDFLTPAVNLSDLGRVILFQHNVETMIWQRHTQVASNRIARFYFRRQAERMRAFEGKVCRSARHVVTVSRSDATLIRKLFGVSRVSDIPTGVDAEFFTPRQPAQQIADLVFVGSMDWLPNVDAANFFVREVLPLIRRSRPECSLAIVGRRPGPDIVALGRRDRNITVTGTVPDVRPYLWGARVAVVPLRIGGGTRLKIYEAMAAQTPVVSTTIGAEGLELIAPDQIRLADTPGEFARQCLWLLEDSLLRNRMAAAARAAVASRFSWETVSHRFEQIVQMAASSD
jgi:sugar transferase (PEP-CTERM/EpsH1 system associated)